MFPSFAGKVKKPLNIKLIIDKSFQNVSSQISLSQKVFHKLTHKSTD